LAERAVVFNVAFGLIEASWRLMLHTIGAMISQLLPSGQQRTVVSAARVTQMDLAGQQKLLGRPGFAHFTKSVKQVPA
jgi:hypothetical protein